MDGSGDACADQRASLEIAADDGQALGLTGFQDGMGQLQGAGRGSLRESRCGSGEAEGEEHHDAVTQPNDPFRQKSANGGGPPRGAGSGSVQT